LPADESVRLNLYATVLDGMAEGSADGSVEGASVAWTKGELARSSAPITREIISDKEFLWRETNDKVVYLC
jgi:hypothetical protein